MSGAGHTTRPPIWPYRFGRFQRLGNHMPTQERAVTKPLWHAADKEKWRCVRATYWDRLEKLKPSLVEEERWVISQSRRPY